MLKLILKRKSRVVYTDMSFDYCFRWRSPFGIVANTLDNDIVVSLNSCHTVTFSFELIPLIKT